MSESTPREPIRRVRREPPRFRHVAVVRVRRLTNRLVRVTLDGPDLDELVIDEPAASVRLLLPSHPRSELVIPTWNGNEFLLPEGTRPILRTFTPIRSPGATSELMLDVVRHDGGAASDWAVAAVPGDRAAVSGPGRGYAPDSEASAFLLTGDETAVPAISQLLAVLAPQRPIQVGIEVRSSDAIRDLFAEDATRVEWCVLEEGSPPGEAQMRYVRGARLEPGARIWAAGEAAAMQRIRRYLFDERGIERANTMIRGYWKRTI